MTQIPRHFLPQIPKNALNAFIKFLNKRDIKTTNTECPITQLMPIQKSVNREKVDNIISKPYIIDASPIIVTSDGFVVDGHHRWVAAKELGRDNMKCLVCTCPLRDFLKLAHQFEPSYVKTVHELTTYGRLGLIPGVMPTNRVYNMIRLTKILSEAIEKLPREGVDKLYAALKLDRTKVTPEEFFKGMNTELEHIDVTHGDLKKTALLVLAHLKETPDYYEKLEKYVEPSEYASDGADDDVAPTTGY